MARWLPFNTGANKSTLATLATFGLGVAGLLASFGFAQNNTLGPGVLADHQRLVQALEVLSADINRYTDQLFILDTQTSQLNSDLHAQRDQAATSFMAMLRLGMSQRPAVLIDPSSAIQSARARSLLSAVRPDILLSEQQTLQSLGALQDLQNRRRQTFTILSDTESQFDTLNVALQKLRLNRSLSGPITGQAETTYLTEIDKILALQGLGDAVVQPGEVDLGTQEPGLDPSTGNNSEPLRFEKPGDVRLFSTDQRMVLPLKGARIATGFQDSQANLQFRHGIVMLARQNNTSVIAPFDGQVIFNEHLKGYGRTVIVRHAAETVSILSGFDHTLVHVGQWLYQEDTMGTISVDNEQAGTLFWQFRRNRRLVNPKRWVTQ